MGFHRGQVTEVKEVFKQLEENFQVVQCQRQALVHFIIDAEHWTVSLSPHRCAIAQGNKAVGNADCTIEMSRELFLGSFNGTYKPSLMDLLSGRIKVDRPEMLLVFKELFGAF
ncbi:MAG: SCP2 sterol-binding domain-containing protein [Acidobacteria bacterium]|nr:SCP2 sterol-binding domain-containing protein [Acidobacteriota bacterium]